MTQKTKNLVKIDEKDKLILNELQKDSGQDFKKLAKSVDIPETTFRRRVQQLKRKGVIKKFVAVMDSSKIQQDQIAFILISVFQLPRGKGKEYPVETIAKRLKEYDEVEELFEVEGEYDLLAKIRAPSVHEISTWRRRVFKDFEGIETMRHATMHSGITYKEGTFKKIWK